MARRNPVRRPASMPGTRASNALPRAPVTGQAPVRADTGPGSGRRRSAPARSRPRPAGRAGYPSRSGSAMSSSDSGNPACLRTRSNVSISALIVRGHCSGPDRRGQLAEPGPPSPRRGLAPSGAASAPPASRSPRRGAVADTGRQQLVRPATAGSSRRDPARPRACRVRLASASSTLRPTEIRCTVMPVPGPQPGTRAGSRTRRRSWRPRRARRPPASSHSAARLDVACAPSRTGLPRRRPGR